MKKFLELVAVISFLVMAGTSYGAKTTPFQIETKNIVQTSIGQEGLEFQISVKSWNTESLEGIWVWANFPDGERQEVQTDDNGISSFVIPFSVEQGSRDVIISLPNYPDVKTRVVTVVYVNHLKYFGPAFTGVEGVGEKENYFAETKDFSNIVMIQSSSVSKDIEQVLLASKNNMWSVISIDHIFFEIVFDIEGSPLDIRLRPDCQKRWLEYVKQLRPYEKTVLGFLGLDEPYWQAIQYGKSFKEMREMLEEFSFQVKRSFPTKKIVGSIYITERELAQQKEFFGYPLPTDAKKDYAIPIGYDWLAVYFYWTAYTDDGEENSFSQFLKIWGERLQSFDKHLHAHQKILLVPGTFVLPSQNVEEVEKELIKLAPLYYDFAKRNPEVVAITPFLWPNGEEGIGLEGMPNLLKVWQKIGKKIVGN